MQRSSTSEQRERGDNTHQSKTMVAMKVRDEDSMYLIKWYMLAAQLYLTALTTVENIISVMHLHNLRRTIMLGRGQRTATSQNMYPERHFFFLLYANTPSLFSIYSESAPNSIISNVSLLSTNIPLHIFHEVQGLVSASTCEVTTPPS